MAMAPLLPKKGSLRKKTVADAYGKGFTFNPSSAKAAASLQFQKMGGKLATPAMGGRKPQSKLKK